MLNLEFIISLWTEKIYPTFSELISIFSTPLAILIDDTVGGIPVIGWIVTTIVSLFPETTLIELILGSAITIFIAYTVIKFFIGIFTGG